jgi:hypothetical protein
MNKRKERENEVSQLKKNFRPRYGTIERKEPARCTFDFSPHKAFLLIHVN